MADSTIYVQAVKRDRKVIISEFDDRHPNGEAWVCGDERVVEVGRTAAVAKALADKSVVEVPKPNGTDATPEQEPNPLDAWPQLANAGYTTIDQVSAADDAALAALGFDAKTIKDIRKVAPKKS